MRHSERVERLWFTRLRWRMRGALLWPAFFGLTLLDGILLAWLPAYDGAPPGLVGCVLLAGFANLLLIAVAAPLAARWLRRRRRPDLPRLVAADYAGTALVAALTVVLLVAGLARRPAVAAQNDDLAAVGTALRGYVNAHAPSWRAGLGGATADRLAPETYRACVPGSDPQRWLCLIVDTDRRPPHVVRDADMRPN